MPFSFPSPLRLLLSLLLLAALVPAGQAQSIRDYGSIYSRLGLGERYSFASSQSEMLGGAGVALRSFAYSGLDNPALWSDQMLTQVTVSAHLQGLEAEDASGERAEFLSGSLSGFQLSLPLYSGRLGFTLAYRPFTRVNYLTSRDGFVSDPELPVDSIAYTVNYEGDGGLQQVRAGLGWRISPHLSLGASVDALFGLVDYRRRVVFGAADGGTETRTTESTRLSGVSGTLGAVVSTTGLFGETDALSLGAAVTLPTRLSGRRAQTLGLSLDRDTLRSEVRGDVTVPLQVVAGLAYLPSEHWTLAADVRYEPWTQFESDFGFGGYDPARGLDELRDRLRIGGGVQVIPAGTERVAPYFARTAYRLGGYWDRGYVAPTDDTGGAEAITTLALTGGLSLPALLPTARFDLGFEVGSRGTMERGLVRDLFVRGSVTVNFGERWFRRRKLG